MPPRAHVPSSRSCFLFLRLDLLGINSGLSRSYLPRSNGMPPCAAALRINPPTHRHTAAVSQRDGMSRVTSRISTARSCCQLRVPAGDVCALKAHDPASSRGARHKRRLGTTPCPFCRHKRRLGTCIAHARMHGTTMPKTGEDGVKLRKWPNVYQFLSQVFCEKEQEGPRTWKTSVQFMPSDGPHMQRCNMPILEVLHM